jgi:hypothetical protein
VVFDFGDERSWKKMNVPSRTMNIPSRAMNVARTVMNVASKNFTLLLRVKLLELASASGTLCAPLLLGIFVLVFPIALDTSSGNICSLPRKFFPPRYLPFDKGFG